MLNSTAFTKVQGRVQKEERPNVLSAGLIVQILLQTQARTNIPGPSDRTLRTCIAESAMTADARIQVGVGSYVLYIYCY